MVRAECVSSTIVEDRILQVKTAVSCADIYYIISITLIDYLDYSSNYDSGNICSQDYRWLVGSSEYSTCDVCMPLAGKYTLSYNLGPRMFDGSRKACDFLISQLATTGVVVT